MIDLQDLENVVIEEIDITDYPDFADAFVSSASFKSTGLDLTDDELDDLNSNYSSYVYELVLDRLY